ncbi:MAG: glycoside hydrolase family 92 protein [Proteobacteria bacterium]|nr:glycoside hydrolase family 92 protein [Pseudomonadota bacterium]
MWLLLACTTQTPWQPIDLVDAVNPFIGTGGQGFGYGGGNPGATAPDGFVKVGPDTSLDGLRPVFNHSAGYHFPDTHLEGISHHRLPGIGVSDGGGVRFVMSDVDTFDRDALRAVYDHSGEDASPGFYSLDIPDRGHVDLTATPHAAHHRYAWESDERWLIVDMTAAGASDIPDQVGWITLDDDGMGFTGMVEFRGSITGRSNSYLPLYTVARFSSPVVESTVEDDKLALRFDTDVEIQVGLSAVDLEGATNNLDAEMPSLDFDGSCAGTRASWADVLGAFDVVGGTREQQIMFASALYHTRQMPTIMTDVDGRYRGMDFELHEAEGWTYYTDFSLWDTYRTLHPFIILVWPELASDHAHSLADMGEKLGFIPRWPAGTIESGSMIGHSAEVVLGESLAKGVTDWPAEDAWEIAFGQATDPAALNSRGQLTEYTDLGYIPHDATDGSVSKTLEYAIDDAGLSLWATEIGLPEDASFFADRSNSYANVFDADTEFMRGRYTDGSWVELEMDGWPDSYTEGNPWQYTFLAPHDPEGLAGLWPSNDAYLAKLTELFELAEGEPDTFMPDPYYWHGNEPDIHNALLFAAAGDPASSQRWVKWIQDNRYTHGPAGLDGNDDGGTLSAWYAFTAIGLFPLNGTTDYVLTTPLFDGVRLNRSDGDLLIQASGEGTYLANVMLDGVSLESALISHDQLSGDHTLVFIRSPEPTSWGAW